MSKDLRFLLVRRASSITRGISPIIIIDRNVSPHIINYYGVCVFQVSISYITLSYTNRIDDKPRDEGGTGICRQVHNFDAARGTPVEAGA